MTWRSRARSSAGLDSVRSTYLLQKWKWKMRMINGRIIVSVVLACSLAGTARAGCPEDLDGDNEVRVSDLIILLGAWGPNPGHIADFDGDDEVRVPDLIVLLGAWGACPFLNDDCETALHISDGDVFVDISEATTSSTPTHFDCGWQGHPWQDLWYTYNASCDGLLCANTCGQFGSFDTVVALYDGCDCPATEEQLLICDDDSDSVCTGAFGSLSQAVAPVAVDMCYKIRIGSWIETDFPTTTTMNVSCLEGVTSNCCYGSIDPGCDDQACADLVCSFKFPECCENFWGGACVELALEFCSVCEGAGGERCD